MASRARIALIVVGIVLLVPLVLVGALVLVVQSPWADHWVERTASNATHREVQVEGIRVEPAWPPTLHFAHIRVSNPPWAKTPNLLDARDLTAQVEIGPLFEKRVVIPFLRAGRAAVGLEQSGEHATWSFGPKQEHTQPSRIDLRIVYLNDGRISYRKDSEDTALDIAVKGSAGANGRLQAHATGTFRGEPAEATATIPSLSTQPTGPVHFAANASLGPTKAQAEGEVSSDLTHFDLKLELAGKTLKDLHKIVGVVLPDTPPFRISGRLRRAGARFVLDPFQGRVGDSDLRGGVTYAKGDPRPSFRGNLQSNLLDFKDLGPLIGAPPKKEELPKAAPEQKQQAAEQKAKGKVLPEAKFNTAKWGEMDADVRLDAKRVLRPRELPIGKVSMHVVLKDGVLHLEPLDFGMAGGRITSDIRLDSHRQPMQADMKVDVVGLQLARLFPAVNSMDQSIGALQGHARLVGHGQSVAEMLGTSDGEIDLAIEKGQVSLLLLKLLDLDVPHVLMLLGTPHKQVELRCAVASVPVKDGVATPQSFIVDTTDTIVYVKGSVNLGKEDLDFITYPRPKSKALFVARSPIEMKGPFRKPKVRPQAGPLAARLGAAIALGAATGGVGALVPLLETGPGHNADCAKLVGEVRAKGEEQKQASARTVAAEAKGKRATHQSEAEKKAPPEKSTPAAQKQETGLAK